MQLQSRNVLDVVFVCVRVYDTHLVAVFLTAAWFISPGDATSELVPVRLSACSEKLNLHKAKSYLFVYSRD